MAAPVSAPPTAPPAPVAKDAAPSGGTQAATPPPEVPPSLDPRFMPESTRTILQQDWFTSHPIDDQPVAQVHRSQVRFRLVGDGPPSAQQLVPETESAALLLADTGSGAATVKMMSGLLSAVDGWESASKVTGISFSTSPAGETLNSYLTATEASPTLPEYSHDSKPIKSAYLSALDATRMANGVSRTPSASYDAKTGWIELNTAASMPMLSVLASADHAMQPQQFMTSVTKSRIALQQAVTPLQGSSEQFGWLEDGIAHTLGTWPSAVSDTLNKMGVPPQASALMGEHALEAGDPASSVNKTAVTSLLEMAGIANYSPENYKLAQGLLQGVQTGEVPGLLADRIVQTNGLNPEDVSAIQGRIVALNRDPEKVLQLQRDVENAKNQLHPPAEPPAQQPPADEMAPDVPAPELPQPPDPTAV